MNSPSPDTTGFQWVIGTVVALLGVFGAWLQLQLSWLRSDTEKAETRATLAIQVLRNELTARYDDSAKIREMQHEDNRAELTATRSLIKATADEATVEHRLMRQSIEKIADRVSDLAVSVAEATKR